MKRASRLLYLTSVVAMSMLTTLQVGCADPFIKPSSWILGMRENPRRVTDRLYPVTAAQRMAKIADMRENFNHNAPRQEKELIANRWHGFYKQEKDPRTKSEILKLLADCWVVQQPDNRTAPMNPTQPNRPQRELLPIAFKAIQNASYLKDPNGDFNDPELRKGACEAWAIAGVSKSAGMLEEFLRPDNDQDIRKKAIEGLGQLVSTEDDPKARAALYKAAGNWDVAIQRLAAIELDKLMPEKGFGDDYKQWVAFAKQQRNPGGQVVNVRAPNTNMRQAQLPLPTPMR